MIDTRNCLNDLTAVKVLSFAYILYEIHIMLISPNRLLIIFNISVAKV